MCAATREARLVISWEYGHPRIERRATRSRRCGVARGYRSRGALCERRVARVECASSHVQEELFLGHRHHEITALHVGGERREGGRRAVLELRAASRRELLTLGAPGLEEGRATLHGSRAITRGERSAPDL